jgi:hypothetical protein
MIDPERIRVQAITSPDEVCAPGLHWFHVVLETRTGRCFITSGEAQHLRQLSTDWVKQALLNLAEKRGRGWLEEALDRSPGLMLHHSDAYDPVGGATNPAAGTRVEVDSVVQDLGSGGPV